MLYKPARIIHILQFQGSSWGVESSRMKTEKLHIAKYLKIFPLNCGAQYYNITSSSQ